MGRVRALPLRSDWESSIRQGGAYRITSNSLTINGKVWNLPTNWDSRKDAYDKAIKAFK